MRTVVLVGSCLAALGLGACFETPTANYSFRCGPAGECPDDYECRDDGCCHLIGSPESVTCELTDAAVMVDAPQDAMLPDATIDAMPDAMPDAATPDAGSMLQSLEPMTAMVDVGQMVDFTVTLSAVAPAGGVALTVTSSDPNIATVPASVTVPEGMMAATFAATGANAGMVTVSVSLAMEQLDSMLTVN